MLLEGAAVDPTGTDGPRAGALARILAAEAGRLPEVERFRREVLRGRLVELGGVGDWIRRAWARQGEPTHLVTAPLGGRGSIYDGSGRPRRRPRLDPRRCPEGVHPRYRTLTLDYPGAGGVMDSVTVRAGGVLGQLRLIAQGLAERYGWQEAQATGFVLTGVAPAPALGTVGLSLGGVSAAHRIRLEVSSRLSPKQVAKLYQEARQHFRSEQLFGLPAETPRRALTAKHAELGVFAAQVNDGRSWGDALAEWNQEHSELRYWDLRTFTRDCRQAFERITGEPLAWRGPRGRTARKGRG